MSNSLTLSNLLSPWGPFDCAELAEVEVTHLELDSRAVSWGTFSLLLLAMLLMDAILSTKPSTWVPALSLLKRAKSMFMAVLSYVMASLSLMSKI